MFDSRKPALWLRLGRRLVPGLLWSGEGVIVRKVHRKAYTGEAHANVGIAVGYGSGTIPARWIVVVQDSSGKEHFVNVDEEVWKRCEVGNRISARNPLVHHS